MNELDGVEGALLTLRARVIARLANRLGCRVSSRAIEELLPGRGDAEALSEALARFQNRGFMRRFLDLVERARLR